MRALEDCPQKEHHTAMPVGYVECALEAERRLARGEYQARCQACGLWAIWVEGKKGKGKGKGHV